MASNEVLDKSRGAACFGNNCLSELLTSLAANTPNQDSLRVGVVGKPVFFLLHSDILRNCIVSIVDLNKVSFSMVTRNPLQSYEAL